VDYLFFRNGCEYTCGTEDVVTLQDATWSMQCCAGRPRLQRPIVVAGCHEAHWKPTATP